MRTVTTVAPTHVRGVREYFIDRLSDRQLAQLAGAVSAGAPNSRVRAVVNYFGPTDLDFYINADAFSDIIAGLQLAFTDAVRIDDVPFNTFLFAREVYRFRFEHAATVL